MAYPTTARVSMLANNQLIIKDGEKQIFQSYSSIICVKDGKTSPLTQTSGISQRLRQSIWVGSWE